MASQSIYDSSRLADGYAFHRPPVHGRVIELVARRLGAARPARRGLDIGCGAGRSTAALSRLVETAVGIEPVRAMLVHHARVAPGARFAVAAAEALPFAAGTFDVITAAGALNYVDRRRCFPDLARLLTPSGVLVVYDFSSGRRSPAQPGLDAWFSAFEERYPFPPGYAMDVQALDYASAGLRLQSYDEYEVVLPIDEQDYLEYVVTETNVERAIREGAAAGDVRAWCRQGLAPLFRGGTLPVAFTGYFACIGHAAA